MTNVHAGPRATSELCRGADGALYPARCCDCSRVVPGFFYAGTQTEGLSARLARECYQCFTEVAPDPTGRCAPPSGAWPSGQEWCCAIPQVDAGTSGDGG